MSSSHGRGRDDPKQEGECTTKYQKELIYNQYLPYSDRLDDESTRMLAEIKYNLGRAVLLKELTPGVLVWCNRLSTYIHLYGRRFSLDDHILFIKLFYELITLPELEPQFVKGFTVAFRQLMKKPELITREDLTLPWRPLYNLVNSIKYSKYQSVGLQKFPIKFLESILPIVKLCRVYFPEESTREMLLEWRPLLCPFDTMMSKGIFFLTLFLPTTNMYIHHHTGSDLWFDELFGYWLNHSSHVHESHEDLTKLFCRLAHANPGFIDWNPHIAKIFNRFLSGLHLPMGSGQPEYGGKFEFLSVSIMARWVVNMMGGNSLVMDSLEQLFTALLSYYYPSNYGRHTTRLLRFLNSLTSNFVLRLHNERFKKTSWIMRAPPEKQISDKEVERFILIVKPSVLLGVFSKTGDYDAVSAVQNLSQIRPDLILPGLLDRTFEAMETLVEPHQLTATLSCITSVSRILLSGSEEFREGPTYILPLLQLILPGIDPNDIRKSMGAFTLISSVCCLLPFVNCSPALQANVEMTEIERQLCDQSSLLEDFVLQFLDRCYLMIDNNCLEQTAQQDNLIIDAMNAQEGLIGLGMASTLSTMLLQSSPAIFESALSSLYNFCVSHVLEVTVSGRMASQMCKAAVKANPVATLKKFIPHCCAMIRNLASVDGIKDEEEVDNELLWNLEIVCELVRCCGSCLLLHKEALTDVIRLTIHLKSKKAYARAGKILKEILNSLSQIYPTEWQSVQEGFAKSPAEHLYIRDWGKPGSLDDLKVNWHTPCQEELVWADELITLFLLPELSKLKEATAGNVMDREALHQCLHIIIHCVHGVAVLLPSWDDEARVTDVGPKSLITRERFYNISTTRQVESFSISVTRKEIAVVVHGFLEHMFADREDDAKSFQLVAKIYNFLISYFGVFQREYDMRYRTSVGIKEALRDRYHGNKNHARCFLIERVQLQHDLRLLERTSSPFTELHRLLLKDLVKLGTSVYTEVRIKSQKVLSNCFDKFDFSARSMLPFVIDKLRQDPDTSHEAFKGALYMLCDYRMMYLVTHYWEIMAEVWPLIVKADHSEKLSIVKLVNGVCIKVTQKFDSIAIEREVPEAIIQAGKNILSSHNPAPKTHFGDNPSDDSPFPSSELQDEAVGLLNEANKKNRKFYNQLIDLLLSTVEDSSINWRHKEMCLKLLVLLIRHDNPLPPKAIRVLVATLNHDALAMRKIAIKAVGAILRQQKRSYKKVAVDLSSHGVDVSDNALLKLVPGDRPDNAWLHLDANCVPLTEEEWNRRQFIDKTHWGFYTWPRELMSYAPSSEQPKQGRTAADMTEAEGIILENFSKKEFVEKLVGFLKIEDKKGKDTFSVQRYTLFRGLFRNYDASFLHHFVPLLDQLLDESLESSHRCASEIISGLIRGSKHWSHDKLVSLWDTLLRMLKKVMGTVMPEMVKDWAVALVTATESRDPYRLHRLFAFLIENPLNGEGGAFGDATRLYLAQNIIVQQEWRVPDLSMRFTNYLQQFLDHPYKSVRDQLGTVLSYLYMFDAQYGNFTRTLSPRFESFVDLVLPRLLCLEATNSESEGSEPMQVDGPAVKDAASPVAMETSTNDAEENNVESDERRTAVRLAKTVLAMLSHHSHTVQPLSKQTFRLLPYLMPLVSKEDDQELQDYCKEVFRKLSHRQLPEDAISQFLECLAEISRNRYWNAKAAALKFLQSMTFHNLFTLKPVASEIKAMIMRLVQDDLVEVREAASTAISGLIHFGFIAVDAELRQHFLALSRTPLKPSKITRKKPEATDNAVKTAAATLTTNSASSANIKRHAGILGLCACVEAYPYVVPEWMPEVIVGIGNHLHDPEPIQSTVKSTLLQFKRTHHDNWQQHKQQFSEDQLMALTDLLISPSYYA